MSAQIVGRFKDGPLLHIVHLRVNGPYSTFCGLHGNPMEFWLLNETPDCSECLAAPVLLDVPANKDTDE